MKNTAIILISQQNTKSIYSTVAYHIAYFRVTIVISAQKLYICTINSNLKAKRDERHSSGRR